MIAPVDCEEAHLNASVKELFEHLGAQINGTIDQDIIELAERHTNSLLFSGSYQEPLALQVYTRILFYEVECGHGLAFSSECLLAVYVLHHAGVFSACLGLVRVNTKCFGLCHCEPFNCAQGKLQPGI